MGIIVSSFIGCGKEYLINEYGNKIKIFDAAQIGFDERDNDSIESYFNIVMDNVNKFDILFIHSNSAIRDKFNENGVDYDIFYPSKERRGEFIENQVRKRTNPNIIRSLDANFEKLIQEIDDDESNNCYKHKLLNNGDFIANSAIIMQYIDTIKNNTKNTNNDGDKSTE